MLKPRLLLTSLALAVAACGSDPEPQKPDLTNPDDNDPVVTEDTVPGAPTGVEAEVTFNNVVVTWSAPASDGGKPVTGYKVTSTPETEPVEVGADTFEALFEALPVDTAFTFTVVAINEKGEGPGATSAEVTTVAPPEAPRHVDAVALDRSVTVTWEAPGQGTVTGYIVSTEPASTRKEVGPDVFETTLLELTNGTSYRARVVAKTAAGNSNPARSKAFVPFGRPGQVQNVIAVAVGTSVDVSWDAADANGSPITEYTVTSSDDREFIVDGESTSVRFRNLASNQTYTFAVMATNAAGTGTAGLSDQVKTFTVPGAPTNVVATTGDGNATVTWTGPYYDGGSPITSYVVTSDPATGNHTAAATARSLVVPNLVAGTRYTFRVRAINAAGDGENSDASAQVLIDTDECVRGTHDCNVAQLCSNNVGSFGCETLLTNLTASSGNLVFSPTTFEYTVPLSPFFSSIALTPTATEGATVRIDNAAVASGAASNAIVVGAAAMSIPVQVQKGSKTLNYTVNVTREGGVANLSAFNPSNSDAYGWSVATDGNYVVIGVPQEDGSPYSNTTTPDDGVPDAGAVYVYAFNGAQWQLEAYLKASNSDFFDRFGSSVDISGDTIVVGAPDEGGSVASVVGSYDNKAAKAGAAYVFTRSGGTWTQQAYLKADDAEADDMFGTSVAISGDTIVVGTPSDDGHLNNTRGSGAAYVFTRSGTTWSQQTKLKAHNPSQNDIFGTSVDVSGDYVIVGAPKEQGDASSTVDSDNNNLFSNPAGAVYIFHRSDSTWSQQAYLKIPETAAGDGAGYTVAIDGSTAVFGTQGVGKVQVYTRSGTTWSRQAVLESPTRASGDGFATRVNVSGDRIAVGADSEQNNGAVHLFTRSGGAWTATSRLVSPNPTLHGFFGRSVGLSSSHLAVGAVGESPENGGSVQGRAYVYGF